MSRRRKREEFYQTVLDRVYTLEKDIQLKELDIQHLSSKIRELDSTLVEAGILEHEWRPEAPKGSSIKPNPYDPWEFGGPTYTKINKVWE